MQVLDAVSLKGEMQEMHVLIEPSQVKHGGSHFKQILSPVPELTNPKTHSVQVRLELQFTQFGWQRRHEFVVVLKKNPVIHPRQLAGAESKLKYKRDWLPISCSNVPLKYLLKPVWLYKNLKKYYTVILLLLIESLKEKEKFPHKLFELLVLLLIFPKKWL